MSVAYAGFNSKRRFGVEIELNRNLSDSFLVDLVNKALRKRICSVTEWGYSCNNSEWLIKPDSSCGDTGHRSDGGGYEVVSAVGHGARHLEAIASVAEALKRSSAQVNKFCGLHVQVEIRDFTDEQAASLLAHWCRLEPIIGHSVPKHRTQSEHCKFHTKDKTRWPQAEKARSAKEFWNIMKLKTYGPPSKRNTITLVNYQRTKSHSYDWDFFDRPTVELRIPESSLNAFDIKNWARFFVHFVETCATKCFPETLEVAEFDEMQEILGWRVPGSTCTVLSPGLYETKCWFLYRFRQFARSQNVLRTISKHWQQIASPFSNWFFEFPPVEVPYVQVSPTGRTIKDVRMSV